MKDRLWFFGGARVEHTTTANLLPQTGVAYAGKNDNRRYEAKLTGTLAPGQTLQGTYIDSRTDQFAVSHPNSIDPRALTHPDDREPPRRGDVARRARRPRVRDRAVFAEDLAGAEQRRHVDGHP